MYCGTGLTQILVDKVSTVAYVIVAGHLDSHGKKRPFKIAFPNVH